MRVLQQISERSYRVRAARHALQRAIRSRLTCRQIGAAAVIAVVALVLGGQALDEATTASFTTVAATPEGLRETVPVPRMFVTTRPGGPAYDYVRRSDGPNREVRPIQLAALSVEDVWSAAFFGDKQRLAEFIEHAAIINGLPVEFLLHLLRQESGLNYQAVSRAGAQGVAQFMPGTAGARGLADPFNPYEAIPKSAELLRDLRAQFGSLGLAAAAYNAGPQRIRNWLSGRSALPKETREYVTRITGRSVEEWRQGGDLYAIAEPSADLR